MKSIFRVVFFLLWSSWGLCAQTIDTDSYFQTAFNWMQLGEYEKSLQAYERAFSLEDRRNIYAANYYNAACAAALSNDKETAFLYLRKAIERGYLDVVNLRLDQDLSSLHQDPRWGQYVDEMEAKLKCFSGVKRELEAIGARDQVLRRAIPCLKSTYGNVSREVDELWNLIAFIDSINLKAVEGMIEQYGWLTEEEVGHKASSGLWLVIQHASLEEQERYLPMVHEAVMAGKSKGSNYAMLIDRIKIERGEKQIYGSQVAEDQASGSYRLLLLEDPANVNERRKALGLIPIESYLSTFFGIEYIPVEE